MLSRESDSCTVISQELQYFTGGLKQCWNEPSWKTELLKMDEERGYLFCRWNTSMGQSMAQSIKRDKGGQDGLGIHTAPCISLAQQSHHDGQNPHSHPHSTSRQLPLCPGVASSSFPCPKSPQVRLIDCLLLSLLHSPCCCVVFLSFCTIFVRPRIGCGPETRIHSSETVPIQKQALQNGRFCACCRDDCRRRSRHQCIKYQRVASSSSQAARSKTLEPIQAGTAKAQEKVPTCCSITFQKPIIMPQS